MKTSRVLAVLCTTIGLLCTVIGITPPSASASSGKPLAATSVVTAAAAAGEKQLVWVGAPTLTALWDGGEPADGPATHHTLGGINPRGEASDFAVDLATSAGRGVYVYVAPQDRSRNVYTKVLKIGSACRSGGGASFVNVGIYQANGDMIGTVTYAHINPTVSVGQWITRWGAKVGTVAGGLRINGSCWTGPHVHLEMYSYRHYACYNRGWRHNQLVNQTNFIGFTGGFVANRPKQACA